MLKKMYLYLKRKTAIIEGFYRHTKYMCEGTYIYDNSIKYLIRNDSFTKNRAFQIFQNNYYQPSIKFYIFLLRNTLFRKKVSISEQPEKSMDFSGSIYRPVRSSNGYNDSKIFDISRNKVLSIFSNKQEYQSVLNNYYRFNQFFPMPKILHSDSEKLLIMEEMVNFTQNHAWVEEDYLFVMEDVFQRNITYFKDCIDKGIHSFTSPQKLLHSRATKPNIKIIKDLISPVLWSVQFPCIQLHGDLWTANTLLVKGDTRHTCFIDWEYSREYLFFYDVFNLMWLEVYVNNNHLYFQKYIDGDYDHYFEILFSFINLKFDEKLRLDYFMIYFLNFFTERVVYLNRTDQQHFTQQCKRLIERMKLKEKKQERKLMTV
ncbi:hypothetical protein QE429_001416 [Bacillus sp. SORGH_AS 510]|uniref:phosphotransferase n=1 Tax=Bacillus sp. SORGH_AS_0510 TaxID=3041771 RepID=UPI00277E9389|nr:phosphotransferase [Bacillus sp. SORGH_AS_0510]MDQ1144589.1 hypothetical protein [Bacillus sp. SORGH_AS_0510]